jgi:hypothetical protein
MKMMNTDEPQRIKSREEAKERRQKRREFVADIEKPVILRGVWPVFAPHILLPPLRVFSSRLRSFAALYLRLAALGPSDFLSVANLLSGYFWLSAERNEEISDEAVF